jgi:hypothetical protein
MSDRDEVRKYPLAEALPPERLEAEAAELERLRRAPPWSKLLGYLRLGGPGFLGAATTLGAGTLTAAMLSGAAFGYKTLWMIWLSMGLGMFMMAASARFTCRGGFRVIIEQNRYHGLIVGSLMTGLVGTAAVAVIFNFGQYSIGTHLIESLAPMLGFEFPRQVNWILFMGLTSYLTLSYGRGKRGIGIVENFMKVAIGVMLICFGICLALVGVDWGALAHGTFVPWLPSGVEGVDLFVASSAAAIGVMDWVLFQYAGLARGWGRKHETLARVDIVFGLFLPFVLINFIVGRSVLYRVPRRSNLHDCRNGHRRGHRHSRSPGMEAEHPLLAMESQRSPSPDRIPGRVVPPTRMAGDRHRRLLVPRHEYRGVVVLPPAERPSSPR